MDNPNPVEIWKAAFSLGLDTNGAMSATVGSSLLNKMKVKPVPDHDGESWIFRVADRRSLGIEFVRDDLIDSYRKNRALLVLLPTGGSNAG